MTDRENPVGRLRFMGAAISTVLAYEERMTAVENAIVDAYLDTYAPDYAYARQIRRILERVMWDVNKDQTDTPRQAWVKNLRESAKRMYDTREVMRAAQRENGECQGGALGCTLPDPSECAVHSVVFKRLQAALKSYRERGGEHGGAVEMDAVSAYPPVPEPERADGTPGGGDGIVIPLPGGLARAMGFTVVPDNSGGAGFYRLP